MYRPHPLDAVLAAALPAESLYAVGGRVRDELRAAATGTPPSVKDLDYVVTGVPLDELQRRLAPLGQVDVVGAAFAVVKVTIDGQTVDVALPRRERSTGAGHRDFDVQSGPDVPLEADLARRDFRMNMLARALPAGSLVDPYGGHADILARRIDILTPQSFVEDPLRMLRAAQFAARFAFAPSPALLEAMAGAAALTGTISRERVGDELAKLLALAPTPSIGLELLRHTGVLAEIWPELLEGVGVEQNAWHAYDVWGHAMATVDAAPATLEDRLAALLHDVGKPRTKDGPHFYGHEHVGADLTATMLGRYRFPTGTLERVAHVVRHHMYVADPELSDAAVRRFIRRIGPTNLEHMFALRRADIAGSGLPPRDDANARFEARVRAELARKPAFSVADLAIGGDDVIRAMIARGTAPPGFRGDARVGRALKSLFEQVTERPERNDRTSLLRLLEHHLDTQVGGAST